MSGRFQTLHNRPSNREPRPILSMAVIVQGRDATDVKMGRASVVGSIGPAAW